MKRKYIQGIEPVLPATEEKEFTVKVENDMILIWRWENRVMTGLYAICVESGEYELLEQGSWHQAKLAALLGQKRYGPYYLSCMEPCTFSGEVSEACALITAHLYSYGVKDLTRLIAAKEDEYSADIRARRKENSRVRLARLMSSVPDIPEDFEDWLLEVSGLDVYYSIRGADGMMHCSCCGKSYTGESKTSGKKTICPHCGAELLVDKRRKNRVIKEVHAALLQTISPELSVARHFDVEIVHNEKRMVRISESMRLFLYPDTLSNKLYYAQYSRRDICGAFKGRRNPYNRRVFDGYLYPFGIQEVLNGTEYEAGIRALEALAGDGVKLNYGKAMHCVLDERVAYILEYLHKGRFHRYLQEIVEASRYWYSTRGESWFCGLYLNGKMPEEIFELSSQGIHRLRELNGGQDTLAWLKWSEQNKKKLGKDILAWLLEHEIAPDEDIVQFFSPVQAMNYLTRQQKESYPKMTIKQVSEQWADYMSMCSELGKDSSDELVYRPRELKRRHEACVEELRKQQAILEMQRNQQASEERAARLRADYPEAEQILEEIRPRYEYANEEYRILVPKNLMEITLEGYVLHHCVAGSDRYFERIERRETYICFLRRVSEPDTPFYTIEVEPGGTIRQHRSYFDEEPQIEEIRGFLKEWQGVVQKRLNEEDKRLAKESQKLREANLAELREKNNTRVLLGLMEDFMEAAEWD